VVSIYKVQYPAIRIAGYRNGYWKPEEEQSIVDSIRTAAPDLLFVAISSPKKEQFLGKHLREMNVPFVMGVGVSFDVVAGITQRAPDWMQKSGLEWLYRFLQEPRRMFRRYFIDDSLFFWLLAKELIRSFSRQTEKVAHRQIL
jgi:N-acetylglucosaminyldiphosphoundecaprenol N-acetyl-beta-D-mannosaminyltransferase